MLNRRMVLWRGLAAGAASTAFGRSAFAEPGWEGVVAKAKAEGRAIYYSSGIAKTEEPLMAQFGKTAGFAVEYARPGGGEIVLRKYEQEIKGGAESADVCGLSDYALGIYARDKGYAATPDLPNLAKLSSAFAMTDPGIYPTGGLTMPIIVNKTMIPDGQGPTKYTDLIDPKYKGKILFGAPENAGTSTLLIKGLVEQHGWDFIKALRANEVSEMRLQAEAMQAVARGEKPICVVAQAWGFLYQLQGAPTRMIFPEDGTVLARYCFFISKKAAHPAAGAVLANHLLSADYQKALAEENGFYGSNSDAPPPPGMPAVAALKIYSPNLVELTAQRGEIIDTWRKIMG
ncbi:ABC transporter substrate-binding protein [Chelatococcus asaccharovorans]|nr:extracellular solute-binding protein [Chelatococcus asaccharovorans]CAH1673435.1 ABC-type Fe3+ transport system substrate-binding protein [Chelatococcus asaccharovorans]CAH1675144.1 ABC-type Fe3+ transport system substrate-binding protein [Chelatococcus asaccharovorans]